MKVVELDLPGVLLIEPDVHDDDRGFFIETWHEHRYRDSGLPDVLFVQDNHSRSTKDVLRGLHFQRQYSQGKLIYVTRGRVFDVAADVRVGSPRYGDWIGCELSDDNHYQLWVPPGFAHGFCVLSDVADLTYKCTNVFRADDEYGISWNDPQLSIDWPIQEPLLSDRDKALPTLADSEDAGSLPTFSS